MIESPSRPHCEDSGTFSVTFSLFFLWPPFCFIRSHIFTEILANHLFYGFLTSPLCVLSSLLCDIYNLNLITYRSRVFICLCCSWKNSSMRFSFFFSIGATSNLLFWILVSTSHMLYHFIVLASCLYLSKLVDFVYNCTIIE